MATSIRPITLDPIVLEAETAFAIDLDGLVIPEQTSYVRVYSDPDNTLPVFLIESGATSTLGGLLVTPGQGIEVGPFLLADIPEFWCEAAASILVSLLVVVSER